MSTDDLNQSAHNCDIYLIRSKLLARDTYLHIYLSHAGAKLGFTYPDQVCLRKTRSQAKRA